MNENLEMTPEASAQAERQIRFTFNATAGEYFKIWIVNVMLMIVTLGIYSAWAKVRSRRYLYGSTALAGQTFDYHADPVKILKERIIVGVLFALYAFGGKISVSISLIAGLLFMILTPWIMVRAMSFDRANTSYRNVRFGFDRNYKGSYRTYLQVWVAILFTLGIGYPWAIFKHHEFRISHTRFGATLFKFQGKAGAFYSLSRSFGPARTTSYAAPLGLAN